MASDDSLWLVKSSGRILGPFPTMKIGELLRSREISVLDEVSPPLRRWQTIQYHAHFKDLVDSLRKATLSEKTEATWTPATSSGLTQTMTDVADSELTEEITGGEMTFTATSKEIVIHDVDDGSADRARQAVGGAGRFQPAGAQNTAIERQVQKTTRGLWIGTVLVLALVAAFIVQRRFSETPSGGAAPTPAQLKQNVVAMVQIGHYAEALKEMKTRITDPAQAGDLAIYYGALLIQVENQTVLGRRLLSQVLSGQRPEAKQAYTGLGIADLLDGQLDSAQTEFGKALALDSAYVPALVNVSAVQLQKGDYAPARTTALKALSISPLQGEALLSLAEATLYLNKVSAAGADVATTTKRLKDFDREQWDYSAEIGLYALYFDVMKGERGLEDKLQAYLDRDPQLTADHRHNVFIYKGRAQWKVLARFCEQIAEKLGDGARVATLLAKCHAHEARWDASRRDIERAVHQSPKDPLIQAWYSYVLRESGDPEQASVILGRANEFNRQGLYRLPALLQARFCQKNGDVPCARENYQRIYENDLEHLPALAGLAWVYAQNKTNSEAVKLIDKGLRISPDYIPLLELRQQAEREGWYAAH